MSPQKKTHAELRPAIGLSQILGGKYQLRILWLLHRQPARYNEIQRSLTDGKLDKPVTPRVLSRELKDLHARGLIEREQVNTVPPRVTYSLSGLGRELVPLLQGIADGGVADAPEDLLGLIAEGAVAPAS